MNDKTESRTGETKRLTAEERAAIRERAKELKSKDGEADLLAKIAEMPQPDRGMAERIHELITTTAPELTLRTYYGMPAYAKDGKVLAFFQPAAKFKARYATLGFDEKANLDDGSMWATSWALTKLTPADEKKIVELVKKAVS